MYDILLLQPIITSNTGFSLRWPNRAAPALLGFSCALFKPLPPRLNGNRPVWI